MAVPQFTFQRSKGEPNILPYNKKASTAITMGSVVAIDSNGFLIPATATSTGNDIVGIAMETVASTDTDYASTRAIAVDVVAKGGDGDRFLALIGTGTGAQTQVGEAHDLDGSTPPAVDVTANSVKCVKVERILSTTQCEVSFLNTGDLA